MEFDNLKELALYTKNTPLPGYILPNFLYLLLQSKFKIDPQYIPRTVYSLTLSLIMCPFYIKERIQFDKRVEQIEITKPPIFIIGHWRSGTTFVQNVLSHDRTLGYFSTFQAYLPAVFLGSEKLFKPLVTLSIPQKRPMDDVKMDADFPQEDQYAMGAFTPYSYYHGWCFPRMMEYYNNSVCMNDVSKKTIEDWKQWYLYLLKKITLYQQGKQLVLKNQDNTGKIRILLEMFPKAKFIFLYRNPYDLYFSMMKFMRIAIPRYCIQKPPKIQDVEQSMMSLYTKIIQNYLRERTSIPAGNLVEVRYEDYIAQPLEETKRIYETLHLEGFQDAKPAFQTYIDGQKSMKRDRYALTKESKQKIDEMWGFAIREFGY